jgi:hypothetical protein
VEDLNYEQADTFQTIKFEGKEYTYAFFHSEEDGGGQVID